MGSHPRRLQYPAVLHKPEKNPDSSQNENDPGEEITVLPMQFGHVIEIHSVKTHYEIQRQKECGKDR